MIYLTIFIVIQILLISKLFLNCVDYKMNSEITRITKTPEYMVAKLLNAVY
jgi:hypothetical protein